MHTKSRVYVVAALVAVATAGCSLNAAAEILYTDWQENTTGLQGNNGVFNPLTFNRYNAADYGGYALHNVQLELEGVGYAIYQLTDFSGAANTVTFTTDITIVVDDPTNGDFLLAVSSIVDSERTVDPFESYAAPGFGAPPDFNAALQDTATDSANYEGVTLTPALVNLFSGTGTVETNTLAAIFSETNATGNNATTVLSPVRVRYNSSDAPTGVPEPASMLLVATGLLLGGGFVTRRRKPGLRALQDA